MRELASFCEVWGFREAVEVGAKEHDNRTPSFFHPCWVNGTAWVATVPAWKLERTGNTVR